MTKETYESIISKARKINELAERGIAGEAQAAKLALIKLMDKYGLTFSDISDDTMKEYRFEEFSFKSIEEQLLFLQVIRVVRNTKDVRYGYYGSKSKRWAELTACQFAEASEMLCFHLRHFRKEFRDMKYRFTSAYASKHSLFPDDHENSGTMTFEEAEKLESMMNQLDDNAKFRKSIEE